jgi:HK97 gp10 family phage protein
MSNFQSNVNALIVSLTSDIDRALSFAADEVVQEQKKRAPKKTGTLANTIRKERIGNMGYRIVAGGKDTMKNGYDYAVGQEFGNHHSPAHPYFYSGYRAEKGEIEKQVAAAIKQAVNK